MQRLTVTYQPRTHGQPKKESWYLIRRAADTDMHTTKPDADALAHMHIAIADAAMRALGPHFISVESVSDGLLLKVRAGTSKERSIAFRDLLGWIRVYWWT